MPNTDELLRRCSAGDSAAASQLLAHHRDRLRRMIAIRVDVRLQTRVDPSDVVQETLATAHRQLPDYLSTRPLPFYPWLRRIACDRLVDLHRRHLRAKRRSVQREEPLGLSDDSALALAEQFLAPGSSHVGQLIRQELLQRIHQALEKLSPVNREILILRHLEELDTRETAAVLGITQSAAKFRDIFGPCSTSRRYCMKNNVKINPTRDSCDLVLANLVDEITRRMHFGEPIELESLAGEHPELIGRLRELLPTLQLLGELKQESHNASDKDASNQNGDLQNNSLHNGIAADYAADRTLGDFRIVREIGRGGMGVVYEAEQISLGRTVALKVLPFAAMLDQRQLTRFRNEARAAAALHHHNIVPVFSVGCERRCALLRHAVHRRRKLGECD